ncbi:MAG: VapC toxin family PIN domain ribonuclease [Hydrogenophilales bacterium 28-61-23]|nr:MAG: VapC toxin family PIN domain ribonuclease [Hydrogenophilales bacterium 28-61-23]
MILLDTNVLSELMRPQPNPVVVAWVNAQSSVAWVNAITQAEISLGIALLPDGKRRDALAAAARQMFEEDFAARCLPFDSVAAEHFARLIAERRRIGRPITTQDAQIAASALANDMPLVTRNTDGFKAIPGLALVDPWNDA